MGGQNDVIDKKTAHLSIAILYNISFFYCYHTSYVVLYWYIKMPRYPGTRQSVEMIELDKNGTCNNVENNKDSTEDWATQYQDYLNKKADEQKEEVKSSEEEEDWAVQYAKYCYEKEKDFFQQSSSK